MESSRRGSGGRGVGATYWQVSKSFPPSAADENLFVARRTLRELVGDDHALRHEALVHGARMQALMEMHEVDDAVDMPSKERMEQILRFLMLREGKLVDDLVDVDSRIRRWVHRLAEAEGMTHQRERAIAALEGLARDSRDPRDQMAALFIERLLLEGDDEDVARDAADVIAAGYLDQSPQLPT